VPWTNDSAPTAESASRRIRELRVTPPRQADAAAAIQAVDVLRRNDMRTIRPLLFLIAIVVVIAACGSAASSFAPAAQPAAGVDTRGNGGKSLSGGAEGAPPANPDQVAGAGGGQIAAVDDAKIIRTGTMSIEVSDVGAALRTARDAIVGLGGYVGASTTSNDGEQPRAEITYRIPASKWEAALDQLRGLNGLTTKVVTEHTESVEVTSQVIDLQARIANLRASETALQGIAEKATKISDVLEVQAQLTQTRGQIETLTAQLKDLNDRAGYATLTVQFNVPILAVEVAQKGWDPGTVIDDAAASMVSVLQGLATAGIWFVIVWLPLILFVGIGAAVAVAIARRLGYGRRTPGGMPPAPIAGEG
jgi:hypothetical protein